MSRRNQTRRRRAYGRRQHEVRERRLAPDTPTGWTDEFHDRHDWLASDSADETRDFDQTYTGYGR